MSHIRATITTRDNVNLSKMTPSSSAVLAFGLLAASSSLRPSDAFQSFTVMPVAAPKVTSRSQTYSRRGEPIVKSRSLTAQSSRSSPLCFRRNTGILSMSTLEEVKSGTNRLMKGQSENSTNFVVYSDIPYFMTPVEELDIAFANGLAKTQNNGDTSSDSVESNQNSSNIAGSVKIEERTLTDYQLEQQLQNLPPFVQKILDKVGKIDESRIVSSREYRDGEVPQLFSNIEYKTIQQPNQHGNGTTAIFTAQPSKTSFLSSSALLAGTALGSGLLTLPNAISPVTNALNGDYGPGFLTSLPATLVAWTYMTISALLTSELLINRCGETGKVRNVGLLELYQTYLGDVGGKVAGVGFLLVSYIMMGVYLSEGGDRLHDLLFLGTDASGDSMFLSRAIFAIVMGSFLSAASKYNVVQKIMIQFFVPATMLAFASGVSTALPTADLAAIWSLSNQHPEVVLNAFPLLFMSWTYHGVVPRVVYDLECNKKEITKAIVGGSTSALIMYVIWNAVMLGNVLGDGASAVSHTGVGGNPLTAIGDNSSSSSSLAYSVTLVTEMAAATSLIGVVLGFVNEFYDAVGTIPSRSYGPVEDNKWKVALLTLLPPALVSVASGYSDSITSSVDNVEIIEYAGAFGASTLFLILPALMAWQCRYGDDARPLTVRPMVPFGKIVLGSLYKAAGTLIVEQGLEKLGVFEFVQQNLLHTGQ